MSNSGGFAVTRTHAGDRFYNPPAMRRHQQLLLQQQQRPSLQKETRVDWVEAEIRTDSDESTLCRLNSLCSPSPASPPRNADMTNLDRLMESVTPYVPVQYLSEGRIRGSINHEADIHPVFSLGDLWESFNEWSVYGVEVPLLLNGSDSVKQYYVPSLSGIQLYTDPWLRPGEDSDVESSRETIGAGSSDCEAERHAKRVVDGTWGQHNLVSLNFQRLNRLTLRDKPPMNLFSNETEVCSSPGLLVFEYLEQEQPHHRQPLYDKVSSLASQNPEIRMYRSCDLLPASWISVAWYPIYRIPVGSTLQNLDASFLTFHFLSIQAGRKNLQQFNACGGGKVYGVNASPKIPLPVFGLASYKLRGSILTPNGANERKQANSLLQAADDWLGNLHVNLPDFKFFASHNSQWR
ncbi:uncharacterized protein LOC123216769 isoform X2 [Mangifera indica]|uniref:uncharacterized protein LOC123216769 isoform X2 n=1 Tax=Mangifera indica TaxID=29780 RepID=UPI001CFA80B0|nr:uncharacterized protein LOC123216769 isoform X2 [Mangifera indica]